MKSVMSVVILASTALSATPVGSGQTSVPVHELKLSVDAMELHGVLATSVSHEGRDALRLVESDDRRNGGLAVIKGVALEDGEILIDVAGRRGRFAQADDRGFVGVAFRVAEGGARYEYIYLRPDNGRADDQERRNHGTQYASHPDFPWQVLRKAFPSRYESYVDLVAGAWTPMRIVINGARAKLHVHGVEQPSLIVNDLKLPVARGGLGLWIGAGTEAFFANLRVSAAQP